MKKRLEEIYEGYDEIPYVSSTRDLDDWIENPEKYPYKKIEKSAMVRLKEGILPGDLIMLWRIGFGNFTTHASIPNYFEYRYGVNSDVSIDTLTKLGFIRKGSAIETLDQVTVPVLKKILDKHGLSKSGKRSDIVQRILDNLSEEEIGKHFDERLYIIEDSGRKVLKDNDAIIQKHGPKQ